MRRDGVQGGVLRRVRVRIGVVVGASLGVPTPEGAVAAHSPSIEPPPPAWQARATLALPVARFHASVHDRCHADSIGSVRLTRSR